MGGVDHEQLLQRFRRWLQEIDASSPPSIHTASMHTAENGELAAAGPQLVGDDAFVPGEPAAARQAASSSESAPDEAAGAEEFGIFSVVEEFTALRHEVKLQTKSARGLQQQADQMVAAVADAIDALRTSEKRDADAAWTSGKALAAALAELDEALDRGRAQLERAGERLIGEPAEMLYADLDALEANQGWLRRLCCGDCLRAVRESIDRAAESEPRQILFAALLEGYGLIQARLSRALAAEGIAAIRALGRPVDPEQMMVVEVAPRAGLAPGVVVEEVRRGYLWNGRVLRCAEVRATPGG